VPTDLEPRPPTERDDGVGDDGDQGE